MGLSDGEKLFRRWKMYKDWDKYPLRVCYTMPKCEVCNKFIVLGQTYFDGGHLGRVHEICFKKLQPVLGCKNGDAQVVETK